LFFVFFNLACSVFEVLWVASIVDLQVFWQPGSITNVLNCRDCHDFESNKYLLFLPLVNWLLVKITCSRSVFWKCALSRYICMHGSAAGQSRLVGSVVLECCRVCCVYSLLALASCARQYNYTRPQLTSSNVLIIRAGRFVHW